MINTYTMTKHDYTRAHTDVIHDGTPDHTHTRLRYLSPCVSACTVNPIGSASMRIVPA